MSEGPENVGDAAEKYLAERDGFGVFAAMG
jgi:hypothetical protein